VEQWNIKWESTPNRLVKRNNSKIQTKDKWEKPPQTEAEIAFDERTILEDLKSLEEINFPYFSTFPKRIGAREFAIGIIGEPDKTTIKGLSKDKNRSLFMQGVLRKNEDNQYQIYWLGSHTYVSNVVGDKYDISDMIPFDTKLITFDDRNAIEVSEVVTQSIHNIKDFLSSLDWPNTFKTVIANLGGDGNHSNEGIQWEQSTKKWTFVPRASAYLVSRKQRKSGETELLSTLKAPPTSVRVYSADKKRGMSAFQWIPGTTDIAAFKTTSHEDDSFTYISVYDNQGKRIMVESYVGPLKYEGSVLVKDADCYPTQPYVVSDTSDLRIKEQILRERIEEAQIKYIILKQEDKNSSKFA